MKTQKSAEHAFGAPISVSVNGEDISFDLIRVQDIVDFSAKIHDEVRKYIIVNLNEIASSPEEKVSVIASVSAGNVQNVFAEMSTVQGTAWFVDRCFARMNISEERTFSQMATPEMLTIVFQAISAASGFGRTVDPSEMGERKEESPDQT